MDRGPGKGAAGAGDVDAGGRSERCAGSGRKTTKTPGSCPPSGWSGLECPRPLCRCSPVTAARAQPGSTSQSATRCRPRGRARSRAHRAPGTVKNPVPGHAVGVEISTTTSRVTCRRVAGSMRLIATIARPRTTSSAPQGDNRPAMHPRHWSFASDPAVGWGQLVRRFHEAPLSRSGRDPQPSFR
jgi:hypothetical protein